MKGILFCFLFSYSFFSFLVVPCEPYGYYLGPFRSFSSDLFFRSLSLIFFLRQIRKRFEMGSLDGKGAEKGFFFHLFFLFSLSFTFWHMAKIYLAWRRTFLYADVSVETVTGRPRVWGLLVRYDCIAWRFWEGKERNQRFACLLTLRAACSRFLE